MRVKFEKRILFISKLAERSKRMWTEERPLD